MRTSAPPSRPFRPEERPLFPGSPFSPLHPPRRRAVFGIIGLALGILVGLGNGLVIANLPTLAGLAGDYLSVVAWLTGIYIGFNASANLLLVKARIELGIPRIALFLLAIYAAAALLLLKEPGLPAAIVLSAASGLASACLSTISIYYWIQSMPAALRMTGLILGLGAVQLGSPLARLIPVDFLSLGGWQSLALLQLGIALLAMAAILLIPLPPTERSKAFEPLDAVTFGFMLVGNVLFCTVLAEGRLLWWADTPWLGWSLAIAIPCYTAALLIEHLRANPLLRLSWYGTRTIATFTAVAVFVRLALSEQSYGSVGLLSFAGLDNDQFHILYLCIMAATIVGAVVTALIVRPNNLALLVMVASLLIAFAAWQDSGSNSLTRPGNVLFTQSLIAFCQMLFIGPVAIFGVGQMLKQGSTHLVSFVILFSVTQNIGGLAGSAMLGTFQTVQARYHAAVLTESMMVGDPLVAARLQQGAAALGGVIGDPGDRATQGGALLGNVLAREAAILGFNDAFMLVSLIALATALLLAIMIVGRRLSALRMTQKGVPQ